MKLALGAYTIPGMGKQGISLLTPRPDNPELEELRLRVLALSKDGVSIADLLADVEEPPAPEPARKPRRRRSPKLNDTAISATAVHALAALGPVLPCIGKQPLTSNGVHGATQDAETIDSWLERWPGCNIGLATGQVVVIDLDGLEGEQSLSDLQLDVEDLPHTLEVRTGNGRHLYFLCDEQVGNSVGKLGPGIDVRGHGGYVIAPPSLHPDTGQAYRFVDADVPIAELPAWVVDLLA